ncbi:hypothetical protein QAD02_023223 [Eretmocerus hayati]|uniref:Uncharacterized protein n=1 Tax=Eretmocerus hayati TaxID=131215 RepID=A0ACC2PV17_9HYME|nr:hypothetical protein QAD02_023223 [Eretmocerus hayati]
MVLSRNDKRKRKEGDLVDLMGSAAENPKRTKIHAQRKFAQGAITPAFSPVTTPVKEKEKTKPSVFTDLITHKRPNTEDFLTFLCFRGTSILPPSLNFFSASCRSKPQNVLRSPPSASPFAKANGSCGSKPASPTKAEKQASLTPSSQKSSPAKEKSTCGPKKQSPTKSPPKPVKLKSATSTIQALKKKYQEQRLAKQRLEKKFKPSVMKTRSGANGTPIKAALPIRPVPSSKKVVSIAEKKRHGLRSTGPIESQERTLPSKKQLSQKLVKKSQSVAEIKRKIKPTPKMLSRSLSNVKNVAKVVPQNRALHKKLLNKAMKIEKRVTRSKIETRRAASPLLSRRPSRKTKEAAAIYMEILGRKLVSPDLDNEDNLSLDSFPELPSAKKIAQTETNVKSKPKKVAQVPSPSVASVNTSTTKSPRKKVAKSITPLKNKRSARVQKYSEFYSDDDSIASDDIAINDSPKTSKPVKRSTPSKPTEDDKLMEKKRVNSPSIRPSRNPVKKFSPKKQVETANSEVTEPKCNTISHTSTQNSKENTVVKDTCIIEDLMKEKSKTAAIGKRKREEKESSTKKKVELDKSQVKEVDVKGVDADSEEESLGSILNKLKKKKDDEKKMKTNDSVAKEVITEPKNKVSKTSTVNVEIPKSIEIPKTQGVTVAKISDDEESFRGFSENTIPKVLDSCQSLKTKKIVPDPADSKLHIFQPQDTLPTAAVGLKDIKLTTRVLSCFKSIQDQIVTPKTDAAGTLVKQEPDFGEMKTAQKSSIGLIDMPKSHGRKERVNMSTEQIEKWLNESSLAKEESKVEMESVSNYKYEPPKPHEITSHLSISPKIQHLVRPVNVTLSKLSDRVKKPSSSALLSGGHISSVRPQLPIPTKAQHLPIANKDKPHTSTLPCRKFSKDSSAASVAESDAVSKSDANSVSSSTEKKSLTSSPERKVFFHQRKPFLPKFKERGTPSSSSASAFSPENESSVYAFETEAETPVSTPFRRKAREQTSQPTETKRGNKSTNAQLANDAKTQSSDGVAKSTEPLNLPEEARKDEEKSTPLLEKTTPKNFELPKNFADLTNIQVLPLDKLTTSWSNVNCSASIAVQVNLDEQRQQQLQHQKQQQATTAEGSDEASGANKNPETSAQTEINVENDDDDGGQLFYIPLQAVTRVGSAQGGQQLIQGVAVKLGTEGPTGPNQRVLLKAKLVTKPPISVARCPPIGTVQPTARAPQIFDQAGVPSTSAIVDDSVKFRVPKSKEIKTILNKPTIKTSDSESTIKPQKVKEKRSSIDSPKVSKKIPIKAKPVEILSPENETSFPETYQKSEEARLVEAPTFRPTEKDFQDPLEYIDKIRPIAEKFGICKVIPPSNFKPECKISDDMRFTAYNQYVHRMLHRWGPNVREMMAIKKYLATQSIELNQLPWIGGMEVDLPHLYLTVQTLGGLKEVIEKKKWQKVADGMKIPKSAQDRVTKLDDIYCKYLLPYDTLSPDEREKLLREVDTYWSKRQKRNRQETVSTDADDDDDEDDEPEEIEECITKGRNMPLNAFYRIARNTQRMWFGETQRSQTESDADISSEEVESAFWRHVVEKRRHVCVHAASIDSGGRGFGFSVAKNSPFGRHPWNLKILTNNSNSVLRALGPQMGVTVPTLHVGMVFSACCWYRDPHCLPWIEYLHTGGKKIWYGIPDEQSGTFREALTKMFPRHCKNKKIWLPSDTAMVPPTMLVSNGVPLCHTVQEPGQFIVVFPKAFTSSICTGYAVSESVYFAQQSWLSTADQVFQDLRDSCEPSIFSFEKLLFSIINDSRSHIDVLKQILPTVIKICDMEMRNRKKLEELGILISQKLPSLGNEKKGKNKKMQEEESDYECDICRANLYVSLVSDPTDASIFCLTHAIHYIEKKKEVLKNCVLMYTYSERELNDLILKLKDRIEAKSKKTNQTKQIK